MNHTKTQKLLPIKYFGGRIFTTTAVQRCQETALLPLHGGDQGKCLDRRALTANAGDTKKKSPFLWETPVHTTENLYFPCCEFFFVPFVFFRVQIYRSSIRTWCVDVVVAFCTWYELAFSLGVFLPNTAQETIGYTFWSWIKRRKKEDSY